jgi:hypothetical protein
MNMVFPGDDSYPSLYGLRTDIQQTVPAWPGQNIGDPPNLTRLTSLVPEAVVLRTWINPETLPAHSVQRSHGEQRLCAQQNNCRHPKNPDELMK